MRAHFTRPVTNEDGDLLPNVQITLYEPGTTTPISQTVYASDTGNDVLTNPFVSATGIIDIYLDQPTRVRIGVIQGNLPVQYYEDVDVLAAGSDSQHTGTGPASLVIGMGATSPGDSATALGPSASAGGTNAAALGSSANALGEYATAIGSAASAQGASSLATGRTATAVGDSATAVGHDAQTGAADATALGHGAQAPWARSTAIGAGAETSSEGQIMLGAPGDITELPQGSALVLSSPDGTRWRITVGDDGSLTTTVQA